MSGIFEVLNMKKPKYNLGISVSRHGEMTAKMLIELEDIMIKKAQMWYCFMEILTLH